MFIIVQTVSILFGTVLRAAILRRGSNQTCGCLARPLMSLLLICCLVGGCATDAPPTSHGGAASDAEPALALTGPVCTNSVGMRLVLIRPGRFLMGLPQEEISPLLRSVEAQREARIDVAFYISTTEVTNAQFQEFVSETGYKGSPPGGDFLKHLGDENLAAFAAPENPVVYVTWDDAVRFCEWLGRREKRVYTLPTEEQWEYTCRAGTRLRYGCTDDVNQLPRYAWMKENSGEHPHPVGSKQPNPWGLYDMNGNVWEWTRSLVPKTLLHGTPFETQVNAFIRGGDFTCVKGDGMREDGMHCGERWATWPVAKRDDTLGFRVVCLSVRQAGEP